MAVPITEQMKLAYADARARIGPEASKQQRDVHLLIGSALVAWATVESTLTAVLERVLQTTPMNAVAIFESHNSSSAKVELIKALAAINLTGAELASCHKLLDRFNKKTRLRNELAHAEYALNTEYFYTATYTADLRDAIKGGPLIQAKPIDNARVNEIQDSTRGLNQLSADIYNWCSEFDAARTRNTTAPTT